MASEQEILLYKELVTQGCCHRCTLRYLCCDKALTSFDYPTTSLVNFGFMSPSEEFEMERASKIKKPNACSVCLGLFQDPLIDEMVTDENVAKALEYKCKLYTAHITFPTCVYLRDHSMKIHLQKMFPQTFDVQNVAKINHFWRYSVEHKLSKILRKQCDPRQAKLKIHFYTNYVLEDEEVAFIREFSHDKQTRSSSRHYVVGLLESISDEKFAQFVDVPPKIPFYSLTLTDIKFSSEPIHLIGNYCKYVRAPVQIPVQENHTDCITADCVESIISRAVKDVVGDTQKVTFHVSSFDDHSTRILGSGRSFYVQLTDPKLEYVPRSLCLKMETIINKSKIVRVKNLKQEDKKEINLTMDSEDLSPRSYKALCIVQNYRNLDQCINAVNMYTSIVVNQKIPIKTLHQNRRYYIRPKKIYYIKAAKLRDNLIELNLRVESGLGISEFIDGDLGRTTPSLSEIMRAKVGLLALDVVDFQATLACAEEEEDVVI